MITSIPRRSDPRTPALCRALFRGFLLAALLVAFLHRVASAQSAEDPVPMAVGTSWTYAGTVWWMPRGFHEIYPERIMWQMEVTDVVRRGPWTAAVLHGHPYDLIWYQKGRERGTYLLLAHRNPKHGGTRLHLLRGELAWEAWRRLQDRKDTLKDLAQGAELMLVLPLKVGKRFCTPVSEGSPGSEQPGPDCWTVRDEGRTDLHAVEGIDDPEGAIGYHLSRRTPADHAVWGFVPGVGFTSFAYGHSGKISAVELELIDFHSAATLAKSSPGNQ